MKMIITETQLNKINDLISESQVKNVTNTLVKESIDDNRYRREVKVSVRTNSSQKFKGMDINDINPYSPQMEVSFDIDQEHRSWGIKDISLNSIKGPSSIDVEVEYFTNDSDDYKTEEIEIPLNWDNISIDKVSNGLITVGDEVEITLYISETGEYTTEISMDVYTL